MKTGNGEESRLDQIYADLGWDAMLKACAKLSPVVRIRLATMILDALGVEILQPHCRLVVRDG